MRAARHDILFEPVKIGPKLAPNRFWQARNATGLCSTSRACRRRTAP